jgi:dTDP-4-amino-4,6-dideoxygalactose transaminase
MTMRSFKDLAISNGKPAFEKSLPIGQLYFPDWDDYEAAFRDIFERQYYTNHGPLVQVLEARLAEYLSVKHVICVTNATIALIMAAECLNLTGNVIVPSFTFVATAQALSWANLQPVFCDVDLDTHHITAPLIEPLIKSDVSAILAVNLWGGGCDQTALRTLADKYNIQLFYDSAHAFGCHANNKAIGSFGAVEVFSFHATKIFSSAEGGCLTTDDDELAKRLRNVRSSYGAGSPVSVVKTSNGRMSEAQATIALLTLDKFPQILARNRELFDLYRSNLGLIEGLRLLEPQNVTQSNHQYVVVDVDEAVFGLSRDALLEVLRRENVIARRYFYPGIHRTTPYAVEPPASACLPNTERLNQRIFQLPIGALVTPGDVKKVCDILRLTQECAADVKAALGS